MPRRPDTPCSSCGTLTWSGTGSRPAEERLCRPCRRARTRTCAHCGTAFCPPPGNRRRTCSQSCHVARQTQVNAAPRRARPCADCGVEVSTRGTVPLCSACRDVRYRERFLAQSRRRRALLLGARSEDFTLDEIAIRDRRRCGICGDVVDLLFRYPDPLTASLDHIVPLSRGGEDTRENIQLAHLRCNIRKGARDQQPVLVG